MHFFEERAYKRVVIKVGSALLTKADNTGLRSAWLAFFCEDIARMRAKGVEVIVVTSGAVALGRAAMHIANPVSALEQKQACAAIGQIDLMHAYRNAMAPHRMVPGQLLITYADFEKRRSYLNIRSMLSALLDMGAVPVINENDTTATQELRFGDNDRLGAVVAQMTDADALFLLSDVDGLYTANPNISSDAKHIPVVDEITPEIEALAGDAVSSVGSGGMTTKLEAAKICRQCGVDVILCSGRYDHPVSRLYNGKALYTLFNSDPESRISARKGWILSNIHSRGEVVIDAGAVVAMNDGNSLLPSGVIDVKGDFERGDTVSVCDTEGAEVGRGFSSYDASDVMLLKGHNSNDIALLTGFEGRSEIIHRDNFVLTSPDEV